jgi:hypothetical protein
VSTARIGGWLQTHSGGQFFPLDPRPEEVSIADVAHALSNLCRFAGHCREFYSVAQHSVLVSYCVPAEHAFQALLHDASEAYMVDMPRPLKLEIPQYRAIEKRVQAVIYRRFGLPELEDPCVKAADDRVLAQEHRDLMAESPYDWARLADERPLDFKIVALPATTARGVFLGRFAELAPQEVMWRQ